MSGYIRDGIAYNSEDEANLAAVIPAMYLDRPLDAGYIAEAILDSDWLRQVREFAWAEGRRDSTDLVSDALGFRVVARNADNPYATPEKGDRAGMPDPSDPMLPENDPRRYGY